MNIALSDAAALGSPHTPLPADLDVLVIGGGVMGLCVAYHLAERSPLRVAVIERRYLASGASGRNGGGVRMQWSDPDSVELMAQSIDIFGGLAQELGINTWFRQGGYLFLARNSASEAALARSVQIQQSVGAPTRIMTPKDVRRLVPALNTQGLWMAAYNPRDGVVFPWTLVWGYAQQAARHGVAIRTHTQVTHIETAGAHFTVHLDSGETVRAARVVNATGAWSPTLNAMLGVHLPNRPSRHEILSSEPLKPFLDPLVVDLTVGLYVSQSMRGELVTGVTMPESPTGDAADAVGSVDLGHSLAFLRHLSRALLGILPRCAALRVLRQWSGPYDVSPDGDAIVGSTPGLPHLIQLCGFTGHGFMMAPAVGRLLAQMMLDERHHPMLDRWSPARFTAAPRAKSQSESLIIG